MKTELLPLVFEIDLEINGAISANQNKENQLSELEASKKELVEKNSQMKAKINKTKRDLELKKEE